MKILIHTCCAPCLIYPYRELVSKNIEAAAFFYNPNIHPYTEYKKRLDCVKEYTDKESIKLYRDKDYEIELFFQAINKKENEPERCLTCWRLRLKKTAQKAKELGFDAFTTTLLVSPYQNQDSIKGIGESISREEDVEFYYQDYRIGFKEAHDEARESGLYMQKYCGCLYSERARYMKEYRKR